MQYKQKVENFCIERLDSFILYQVRKKFQKTQEIMEVVKADQPSQTTSLVYSQFIMITICVIHMLTTIEAYLSLHGKVVKLQKKLSIIVVLVNLLLTSNIFHIFSGVPGSFWVFYVNFKYNSQLSLVFFLLTLNRQCLLWQKVMKIVVCV